MKEVLTQRYQLNRPAAVAELVGDEVVAINLETGSYYGMPGIASQIWGLILDSKAATEIVDVMCSRYGGSREEIERHVLAFIGKLLKEDLITPDSKTSGANPLSDSSAPDFPGDGPESGFQIPELQKYTDMQEFLLVDPIHEVDVTDWPTPGRREKSDDAGQ